MASIGEDVNGELWFCNTSNGTVHRLIDLSAVVRVSPRVVLAGAYDPGVGMMNDDLRVNGLVPGTEPYTALGYARVANSGNEQLATGALNVSGANAIVDWVRVELRSVDRPTMVVAARQGVVQRDGDVVASDGSSPLLFHVGPGSYHVAIHHRNHLACMTGAGVSLNATAVVVDLTSAATATYGTDARTAIGVVQALWPGNAQRDATILYVGAANDRDAILQAIGGTVPTNTVVGYHLADIDLDGIVKYTGTNNDRDRILGTIGGLVPTNSIAQQLP
jgi:hypothetical protein